MRLAVVSPFLDRRHGTERCIVEQIERMACQPGWDIHIYAQRVEDLAVVSYAPGASPAPPGSIIWHRVCAIPGPHLLKFLWWFVANWFQRRYDARFRSLHFDLVYSPGINCLDADAIAVHIVFREFLRLARQDLRLRNSGPAGWPRLIHRLFYYWLIIALEKRVYSAARVRLAAVSQLTASELARHFRRTDVTVISNAVDVGLFRPSVRAEGRSAARRRWSYSPQDFVLLLVGNDWKKKGLPQLLEATARCPDLPLRLLVVGSDEQSPYRRMLERFSLQDRVHFAAPSPDVLQFYAAADVYVGPSLHDSFALPPAEAMACGLPVITSAQNGGAEMITNGVDGFILPDPRDVAAFARLIRLLYEQPQLRNRMAENAARTAQQYTWERNAAQTLAFLTATLTDKHAWQTQGKDA
jgi:glycosyltransferase involved in cell wall biosynthesis